MRIFSPETPVTLAEGTRILLKGRHGTVYRTTIWGCELVWDESVNAETGEVLPPKAGRLEIAEIARAMGKRTLVITDLPAHLKFLPPKNPAATAPRPAELGRATWRERYVKAAQTLIDEGKLKPMRADFVRKWKAITDIGFADDARRARENSGSLRAGKEVTVRNPPSCGETIFAWWRATQNLGPEAHFDRYRNSGNRTSFLTAEEEAFIADVLAMRLTEERPSIQSVVDSVQSFFRVENEKRKASGSGVELTIPGYGSVWSIIARMAPIDHKIRTRGMEVAYRDLHPVGRGLRVDRALQRVEIDEYTTDLMTLLRLLELDGLLTLEEKVTLGLTGEPVRLIMSAAIDVYTGAIVAMQIAPAASMNLTVRTIEMIYLDKSEIAKAAGATYSWPMHGHPQSIAFDRAGVNMSDELYLRLGAAGITNLAVPAGKPFLKPWIEGLFRTFGARFLPKFPGRTFSDVVKKGENDPGGRASLTLDEFLKWLVMWVVDVHHTTQPETLGRAAPLLAWERAVAEAPPFALADERRLRMAFGERLERTLTRKGVKVLGLNYQLPEAARKSLTSSDRDVEVYWWHRNIGRVEVRLSDGRWVTAECTDPMWHDKSYDDLAAYVARRKLEARIGQDARDRFNTEADLRTSELLALRRMLPLAPTAAEIDHQSREFARYLYDPEIEREPADLFADEIDPIDADPGANGIGAPADATEPSKPSGSQNPSITGPDQPNDYGDFME
jgi:putative transposase